MGHRSSFRAKGLTDPDAPKWLQPGTAVETEDPTWIGYGHVTFAELLERVAHDMGETPEEVRSWSDLDPDEELEVKHLHAVTFMKAGEEWIRWRGRDLEPVPADYPGAFPVTVWEP